MPKQRSYEQKCAVEDAVRLSPSAASALRMLGLRVAGGNYKTLHSQIAANGLDTSHWTGQAHLRGRSHNWARKMPLSDILIVNSSYRGGSYKLKMRLIAENALKQRCALCGITQWRGLALRLHLDHVNGKSTDNRLENLRLLCPNCHSQTDTYCGKNKRRLASSCG